MKNSLLIFAGLIILGVCLIVSSIVFSNSLNSLSRQNHIINGSLGISQSINSESTSSEYFPIGEVASLLGYNNIDDFKQDIINDKLGNIPYVNVNGELIFSRTVFDEWLIESARLKKDQ